MAKFILEIELADYANAFTISSQLQKLSNKMWSDGKTNGNLSDNTGDIVGHYEVI